MKSARNFCVVLVTCPTLGEARRIARQLVSVRLAACVNVLGTPVESFYRWKGEQVSGRERLLLIKTTQSRLPRLEREVHRLHTYEVPEFISLPLASGSAPYLAWLGESVRGVSRPRS